MALLKKIRSSTLMEALVATVLIVIIFMIASLVLNNVLLNSFSKNTHAVETRISELEYQMRYSNIPLPYSEEFKNWNIRIEKETIGKYSWITATGVNKTNKKEIIKTRLNEAE